MGIANATVMAGIFRHGDIKNTSHGRISYSLFIQAGINKALVIYPVMGITNTIQAWE
jgi:hypothetical protein